MIGNLPFVVFQQVAAMFLMMVIGFVLCKAGKLGDKGAKDAASIMLYISLPCVIIKSFLLERTAEHIRGFLISFGLAVAALLVSAAISHICFSKDKIAFSAAMFPNPGAFGVFLITAALGEKYVFYSAPFIALLNLTQWTAGVAVLTGGKERVSVNRIVRSPILVAMAVGLVLFFTAIPLPVPVTRCIDVMAATCVPLAMMTAGYYLTHVNPGEMIRRKSVYAVIVVRLLIIPLLTMLLFRLIPAEPNVLLASAMVTLCPTGSVIATYAHLYEMDYAYAVETFIATTLASIITAPLLVFAALKLFSFI